MHIAAYSITNLRSAQSVLKALGVAEGMVFEVPSHVFDVVYREVYEVQKKDGVTLSTSTYINFDNWLYVDGIRFVLPSRLNFHRYKLKLFRVLPPASSTR